MQMQRRQLFGCFFLVIVPVGLLTWIGRRAFLLSRYNRRSDEIRQKIQALRDRRPEAINPEFWEKCLAWAGIAEGNICFSEEHVSYERMCRFEEQLDEKLKEPVDLGTIEWIGDSLAETGPHGQQYMTIWRKQWQAIEKLGK